MVNAGKPESADDRCIDAADQNSDGEESVDVSLSVVETPASMNLSLSRRLTEIFLEDGDEDLLLQRSDREDGVLQWLRALDMQVMGACRADERLKPLLKLNTSSGDAEDRLLAQLGEHFEPSEVGLLARCLCVPLVSIRVGKIDKQGTLLSPTSIRGNLCVALLPTSDLRISFNGDDAAMERLATLSSEPQCTSIEIEELSADKSGRSFFIKTADGVVSYFWCAEKSQLLGNELLRKMKDLLMRKPSLAELTGISGGRLNSFATHLRAYLGGSTVTIAHSSGVLSASGCLDDDSFDFSGPCFPQSSFTCEDSSRIQRDGIQGSTTNLNYRSRLCPRSSSLNEGLPTGSSGKIAARGKLMLQGENIALPVDSPCLASIKRADLSNSNWFEKDKLPEANGIHLFSMLNFVDAFGKPAEFPLSGPKAQVPSSCPSHFSPHYCWCPPVASTLEHTLGNSQLTSSSESLYLPPLSSLISAARSSNLLTSKSLVNSAEVPPVDFPTFLPDPLMELQTSQQIPTFTNLIYDPIVHIPMIDVGSSGPGYLVSAVPAIATTIQPLNPNLVEPVLSNAESMVEKSARETLRMLISSTNQPNPQLGGVLPSGLSSSDDKQNIRASRGSRGFYSGTRDINAISSGLTTVGLVLLSEKSFGDGVGKMYAGRDDSIDKKEKPSSSGSPGFDAGME